MESEAFAPNCEVVQKELPSSPPAQQPLLTDAQRARIERQRVKAKALREARLIARPLARTGEAAAPSVVVAGGAGGAARRLLDSGGGFLVEVPAAAAAAGAPAPRPAPRTPAPAPPRTRAERPRCQDCEQPFDVSYLMDTFDYSVCDDCRDDEEAHALVTRTEAKSEFLLQDCDLDARSPPLRCVTRRNPHRLAAAPMRLYLRAQVRERAEAVWGGAAGLRLERERRRARHDAARGRKYARELRALRMQTRGSLYAAPAARHEHEWGAEEPLGDDNYRRTCTLCTLTETYEKM